MTFSVPFSRNLDFIGRDTVLQNIASKSRVAILQGPNGIGKSQVAIEHAYRSKARQPNGTVIWLAAHGFWRLTQSIKEVTRSLSLSRPDISSVPALLRWLHEELRGSWLLILDDLSFESFPEEEKLQLKEALKALQYSTGMVLITSTIGEWKAVSSGFDVIQLSTMSMEQSFQLLERDLIGTSLTKQEKSSIVKALESQPLALRLASSYLLESENIAKGEGALMTLVHGPLTLGEEPPRLLSLVLDLSLGQLEEENQPALKLLYLMSVLDIQGIPITSLIMYRDTSDDKWRLSFHRAIRRLLSLSLIQSSFDQFTLFLAEPIRIHLYGKMKGAGILANWQQKAIQILAKIFPDHDSNFWRQCETLLPHAYTVLATEPNDDDPKGVKVSRAILLRQLGKYNQALGNYGQGSIELSKALKIYQNVYGDNVLNTLKVEREMANILNQQGKAKESEVMLIRILDTYKASLPENHYLILTHYNSLAAVVQNLGKLDQAEEYCKKALQGYQQIYSPTHADTLIAKWNLAIIYNKKSRYQDARKLFEELLQAYRGIYDETHPSVLETICALATTLLSLNENDHAIKMLQEAVSLAHQTLQATYPQFLALQASLAGALSDVGRLQEAETLQRQILATNLSLRPPPQPQSLVPALNLACTLEKLSRFQEARQVLEPATQLAADILEPTHLTLLGLQGTLALVYLRLGQYAYAESQFRSLVQTNALVYGENGRQTLVAMNNLGGALQQQGKYADAVVFQTGVLQRCNRALGEKNALTLRVGNNLAESLRLWAESGAVKGARSGGELLADAEELHRAVLKSRTEVLGESLDTWISSVNLGTVLQTQGKGEAARGYFGVLEKLEGVAGSGNAVVVRGKERLALLVTGNNEGQKA